MVEGETEFIETTDKIFSDEFIFLLQIVGRSVKEDKDIGKNMEEVAKSVAKALEGNDISCCLTALTFHITQIIASDKGLTKLLDQLSNASSIMNQKEKVDGYIR